jgi:hypothetical protein
LGNSALDGLLSISADAGHDSYLAGATFSGDKLTSSDGFQGVTSTVVCDVNAGIGPALYVSSLQPDRVGISPKSIRWAGRRFTGATSAATAQYRGILHRLSRCCVM